MKTWMIVKREDLSILDSYEADVKDDTSANRSWLHAEPVCAHVELPDGEDKDYVSASLDGEEVALSADQAKIDAKVQVDRERQLALMRQMREPKLVVADHMVNDLVTGDRTDTADVQAYRNSLKDITNTFKDEQGAAKDTIDSLEADLSNLTWPTKP